ncbi:MAG: hypothetical protein OEV91_03905 [Desulfobulbaceae bacterium]|nr:hypothetical protein [Desulfobulbaceae bacterium]
MDITAIDILSDTTWLPVSTQPIEMDAPTIGAGQLFLGRCKLPPGRYQRLRFTLGQASIRNNNGQRFFLALDAPTVEIEFPAALSLERTESRSLFITWDEENSLRTPPILRPTLYIAPELKQMVADLAYVACPDIDTVYVIRTDKNWVCDSMGVTGHPSCLAAVTANSRQRLYILAPKEAAIKVLELPNNFVDSLRIPMTVDPEFMTVSPNGRWAYILDAGGGYVLRMDLETGDVTTRVRLGHQPRYATYIAESNLLAVTSALSQTVFLLDPTTLTEVGQIPTGRDPNGLLAWDNLLYITESGANTVTICDLNTRTIRSRLTVGFSPRRLIQNDNQIYVSNHDSDSISILQPGQLSIVREINLTGPPLEMAAAPKNRWLYAGNEKIGGLSVVDATTNRVAGQIIFGATPQGLAVIQ